MRSIFYAGPVSSIALGWFQLWPLAEVESRNEQYHVAEFAPELLAFGSDGGGEMLAMLLSGGGCTILNSNDSKHFGWAASVLLRW
jgi:hypothetical protein